MTVYRQVSQGRVRLRAGTLHGALDRLVGQGLVAAAGEDIVDGRLRRSYRLTESGQATLAEEAGRLARHAAAPIRRLRPAPGAGPA